MGTTAVGTTQDHLAMPALLSNLSDAAEQCRLLRHVWREHRVVRGATVDGHRRSSWFTIELYCTRGCGTIRKDFVDNRGYKWKSRHGYDPDYKIEGGITQELLAGLRLRRIDKLAARSVAEELTTESSKQLALTGS